VVMHYLKEKDFLVNAFQEAYKKFYNRAALSPEYKTEFDIVTSVDCGIEDYLIAEINKQFPGDVIFSEERNAKQQAGIRTWIIDPIDGTVNMSHGIRLFGLQGALQVDGETVMSVIYLPNYDELYYAIKRCGAFCNGQKLSVAKRPLGQAVVSFSDYPHDFPTQSEIQQKMIKKMHAKVSKIRMFGAACVDFTFVASGKIDATVCGTGYLWDIAPGMLLCSEAGASVVNIKGYTFTQSDFFAVAVSSKELKALIIDSAME